jgi:HlyD family secretion protein
MMASGELGKIGTPVSRHFRIFRRTLLPSLVFLCALAFMLTIRNRQWTLVEATGVVEQHQVMVAPLLDGTIRAVAVDLLDTVQSGQVLAVMDDTVLQAELNTAEAELARIRASLDAEKSQVIWETRNAALDRTNTQRRLAVDEEIARLDWLDRTVQQESDRISLQLLALELKRQQDLFKSSVSDQASLDSARLQYEALEKQVTETESVLTSAKQRLEEAASRNRQTDFSGMELEVDAILRPIQEELRVQESIIKGLQQQRDLLTLKAPGNGKVQQLLQRPGDTIVAGTPVMVLGCGEGTRILGFVDLRLTDTVHQGDTVEIYSRRRHGPMAISIITKVGAQMEPFPVQLLSSAQLPQWGYPVLIGELPKGEFIPGEVVDIRIID